MVFSDENGDCLGSYQEQLRDAELKIAQLEAAIRRHHERTAGHQMCWENDEELWSVVGITSKHPQPPEWCEFMTRCAEYRASRDK